MSGIPKVSTKDFLEAVREGVYDAFWDMIRNATHTPCADFFDCVKQGVKEAMLKMKLGGEGRNNALNRAAFSLGQLVAAGLMAEDDAVAALESAAAACGLGKGEAAATVRSGLNAGKAKPRQVPAGSSDCG